jgi:hypothetical protein
MEFELTFEIEPSAPFGLPQDGVVVLPASPGAEHFGDTLHSGTLVKVGHGSLSKYRLEAKL